MKSEFKKFTVPVLKTRLDKFLAEQDLVLGEQKLSRSKIQRDIEAGQIVVNGEKQISPKFVVRKDDIIGYELIPEEKPQPKNIALRTLYNNNDLLILDKPAGLVVHPGAGFKGDSLAQALLYHFKDIYLVGEDGRNGIVHRLDKDTSGVILIALTPVMYEHLKDSFANRKIVKEYIALVCGKIKEKHGKIDAPLGKSQRDFRKYTTNIKDMLREKPSLTEYWVEGYFTSENSTGPDGVDFYTLIKVKLHTGRTHQIRVHFSSLGFPLVGDELYGGKKAMRLGLQRQFLHAKKISVQLPDGQWIEAESDLPDELQEVLKNLRPVN